MLRALLRNPVAISIVSLFGILAIVIVPLSMRQAPATSWWLHEVASCALAIGVATLSYRVLFVGVVWWWHVLLGCFVTWALPLLATA